MDKRLNPNYVSLAALICYILGRVLNKYPLYYLGMFLMTVVCVWTLMHWKENSKMSNYISIAFLVLVGLSLFGL